VIAVAVGNQNEIGCQMIDFPVHVGVTGEKRINQELVLADLQAESAVSVVSKDDFHGCLLGE
jgi:hypothetical protein